MKNFRINKNKLPKLLRMQLGNKTAMMTLCGVLTLTGLTGCSPKELSNSVDVSDSYDRINSNSDDLIYGVVQELDVPGEQFKLVMEYNCLLEDSENWTVTGNKNLYMKIYTKGLPENKKVYIDNIHIDTTIMSAIKQFDDILQDTMDDRIHNSLMLGFPISDDTYYYGVNAIEGQNDSFIQGFVYGYNGFHTSSIEEKRFLESDYLEAGVFANKITSVCGLLIQEEGKDEPYGVDVLSTLRVDFCNVVAFVDDGTKYYQVYEVDEYGNVTITKEENNPKVKKLN